MKLDYNSYKIIAQARGEKVLFYKEAGTYSGDWVMLSYKDGLYYFYKDYYGSCSGCDNLLSVEPSNIEDAKKFAEDYRPFIAIREDIAAELSQHNELITVLPKNIRDESWSDISWPDAILKIQKKILSSKKLIN